MEKQLTASSQTDQPVSDQSHSEDHLPDLTSADSSRPAPVHRTLLFTSCAFLLSAAMTGAVVQNGGERFSAELQADVASLPAPADGIIEWMEVEPGQIVLPGTDLFIIRDTQLEKRIQQLETRLERHRIDLDAATARSELEIQQRTVELESAAFETELTLTSLLQEQFQRKFESTAWGDYLGIPDALASTEIPPIDLRSITMPRSDSEYSRVKAMIHQAESENDIEALDTRIELCELRLKELRQSIDQVPSRVTTAHRVPVLKASVEQMESDLKELQNLEAERIVRAPIYGMAGVLRAGEQDIVSQGDLLLEVFDRDREFASVNLPRRVVALLEANQTVTVHFPDGEHGEGTIESIPPQFTGNHQDRGSQSTVSLKVRPSGKPWPTLPIGSSLEVTLE